MTAAIAQKRNLLLWSLIACLSYYLAARFGFSLKFPYGYASPIWPAAGVALGFVVHFGWRILPALMIGYILAGLHFGEVSQESLLISICIACGAALQALVGGWLVTRTLKWPSALEEISDYAKIVLYAGVLACVINANVGSGTLFVFGILSGDDFVSHWFGWWAGDLLGVVVFGPLTILLLTPKTACPPVSNSRKAIVGFSLMTVFLGVVYTYSYVVEREALRIQSQFRLNAEQITQGFEKDLAVYNNILASIERFISSSEKVTYEEFTSFSEPFMQRHQGIQSLSWNPKVTSEARSAFEKEMQEEFAPDFIIKERPGLGQLTPAGERDVYYPVAYPTTIDNNRAALGFDTYAPDPVTNDVRIRTLDQARDEARPIVTGRISVVQAEGKYGMIVYHPVYRNVNGVPTYRDADVQTRRELHIGYVAGVFVVPDMLQSVMLAANARGTDLILLDVTQETPVVLFDSRTTDYKEPQKAISVSDTALQASNTIEFSGHTFELKLIENGLGQFAENNWIMWSVITGGLLFSGFFGAFILFVTGRTEAVKRLVQEKTRDLAEARQFQQLIYDNNPDLVFVKNANLDVIDANHAFRKLYPEAVRNNISAERSEEFHQKEADQFHEDDRTALRDGYFETVEEISFPNGETKTLFTKKVRFENAAGKPFILGIARDMTEFQRTQKELKEANAELEEFAYRTSHDLRAPIVAAMKLMQHSSTMLASGKTSGVEESLNIARRSLQKLETLIVDILSLTEAKNKKEDDVEVDVIAMVQETMEKYADMEGFGRIDFQYDFDDEINLTLKRGRLKLILDNLISNAIKYQDLDEPKPFVRIATKLEGNRYIFSIEDNGLGIPEKHRDKMFQMFSRLHPRQSYGSGLGLYMIRKSIDILGGKVDYIGLEKGSRFVITLPYKTH